MDTIGCPGEERSEDEDGFGIYVVNYLVCDGFGIVDVVQYL